MNLLGKATDNDFWKRVREEECFRAYRDNLHSEWDAMISGGSIRALRYSDFKLFFTTGNRSVYERTYFEKHKALTVSALLSIIYPDRSEYSDYLMDVIYAVCDEYTWCLPAHQPTFEENNNSHIDLFASLTGHYLSEIYVLLGDRLDPLIRSRILAELDRRIFTPFSSREPYWWWETGTSNWTAVCMGSVACTYMLIRPDEARALIPRFMKSMKGFISGFSDEGVCYEGGAYWNFGFGSFLQYADMIRIFTSGEIDYFTDPKIKKIAGFYQKLFLSGKAVANFADCGQVSTPVMGRMHYLKKEYPDEVKSTLASISSFSRDKDFPIRLREAIWYYEESQSSESDECEFYAPSAEWYIKRTPCYGFALKGGHNAEHHNHNDVGEFIFAAGGKQIICDLGPGEYTKQYFSPERYLILQASSRGHSVPIVDAELQRAGKEYSARNFKYENGRVSVEISGAYGIFENGEGIERSFDILERGVRLTDSFTFSRDREVTERLITKIKPILSNGVIILENCVIEYDTGLWYPEITSEPLSSGECFMIDFKSIEQTNLFTCLIYVRDVG